MKQDGCLLSQRDIWSSCWCVLSGVSGLWEEDSDTAAAAEWNQWWMACQNGPRCRPRRLCWQAQLSHLAFSISRANRGSCWPQMWHVNIAPVIAHLSTSHSQRARFHSPVIERKLAVMDKHKKKPRQCKHFTVVSYRFPTRKVLTGKNCWWLKTIRNIYIRAHFGCGQLILFWNIDLMLYNIFFSLVISLENSITMGF